MEAHKVILDVIRYAGSPANVLIDVIHGSI